MKILIDIPEAFEVDYNADRFAEFFHCCFADMGTCCGNFEFETAVMMEKAFAESRLYDPDKVVEQLESELRIADKEKERCARENPLQFDSAKGYAMGLSNAIEIVKAGGTDDTH